MATLFFVVSKLLAFLLQPATWLVLVLLWAWRALRRDRPDRARRVLGGTLAVLLVLSVVPVGDMALRPLETAYPVRPALGAVDTIIVLGGGEDIDKTRATGLVQLGPGGERMTEAERNLAAIKRVYWLVRNECEQRSADGQHLQAEEANEAWELIVAFIEDGARNE